MATLYRRPNSSVWWTAYFDREGKRHYKSTGRKLRAEAMAAAAQMEVQARRASPEDDERRRDILRVLEEAGQMALRGTLNHASGQALLNRMAEAATGETLRQETIEGWLRGWLREKSGSKSKGTFVRYEGVIESFLKSLAAAKRVQPLSSLAFADIQQFRDALMAGGRTAVTANIAVKILRAPLNLARKQGLIPSNPAEAVEFVAVETAEKEVFSPGGIAALLRVAGWEWQGLILAGFYTGGRLGDLANLKWSSVDDERKTLAFGQRKTKRFVEIPIHKDFAVWLNGQRGREEGDFVFPSFVGKRAGGESGLSRQFRTLMGRAGIKASISEKKGKAGRDRFSLSFHSLRHSFNSAMANAGVAQELRQRLTGHASKAVNDRYTHAELETLRKAIEVVPAVPDQS